MGFGNGIRYYSLEGGLRRRAFVRKRNLVAKLFEARQGSGQEKGLGVLVLEGFAGDDLEGVCVNNSSPSLPPSGLIGSGTRHLIGSSRLRPHRATTRVYTEIRHFHLFNDNAAAFTGTPSFEGCSQQHVL